MASGILESTVRHLLSRGKSNDGDDQDKGRRQDNDKGRGKGTDKDDDDGPEPFGKLRDWAGNVNMPSLPRWEFAPFRDIRQAIQKPVVLLCAGWYLSYSHSQLSQDKSRKLARINEQIRYLYGPLIAVLHSKDKLLNDLVRDLGSSKENYTVDDFRRDVQNNWKGPLADQYRLWLRSFLQHLNEQAAEIAAGRLDLLEEPTLRAPILEIIAHSDASRAIMAPGIEHDRSFPSLWASAIDYPDKLVARLEEDLNQLQSEQHHLQLVTRGVNRIRILIVLAIVVIAS